MIRQAYLELFKLAAPILFQGGTPVFTDADAGTWNMDPDLLAEDLERVVEVIRNVRC